MKITKNYLKQIIKEEIKSINQITFDVDKTSIDSGNMPYAEINVNFPNSQLAQQYLKTIQDNFKTLVWKQDDRQLYTQIHFRNLRSLGERYSHLQHMLDKIKKVFEPLGIKQGKSIQAPSPDDDYPSKPTLKIVK